MDGGCSYKRVGGVVRVVAASGNRQVCHLMRQIKMGWAEVSGKGATEEEENKIKIKAPDNQQF